jgi:hypothetical protein
VPQLQPCPLRADALGVATPVLHVGGARRLHDRGGPDDRGAPTAVVVDVALRPGGSERRVRTWTDLCRRLGFDVVVCRPVADPWWRRPGWRHLPGVVRGDRPVEQLWWDPLVVRRATAGADLVVSVTLRALEVPASVGTVHIVDYVDRLSDSYRHRAQLAASQAQRAAYAGLAWSMRRAEAAQEPSPAVTVAAGRRDAAALAARWLPILLPDAGGAELALPKRGSHDGATPAGTAAGCPHDLVFVGTLDYAPNMAALALLAADLWPELRRARPETTLLVAGRRPTPVVRRLVTAMGARLVEDFPDGTRLCDLGRIAIVPLPVAAGMQIKLLDAAAAGLPIVASPAAMAGVDPDFPAVVAPLGPRFVAGVLDLLGDPAAARRLGRAAARHVAERYSVARWAPVLADWLAPSTARAGASNRTR